MNEEKTKNQIIEEIEAAEGQIKAFDTQQETDEVPPHDFYRAVMFTQCLSCSNRMVDVGDYSICQPGKKFLHKYRCREHEKPELNGNKQCSICGLYPWKSDYKLTNKERSELPVKVA